MNKLAHDRRGSIAVTFGVSLVTVIIAIGSGIDLSSAYFARQQLSGVATLACQYANRPNVVALAFGSGGSAAYIAKVDTFITAAVTGQHGSWSQTTAAPFTYTAGSFPSTPAGTGSVTLTASVPTAIMNMIGITSVPVSASVLCFNTPASVPQPVPDASTTLVVMEGFENSAYPTSIGWYLPGGTRTGYETGTAVPLVNTTPTNAGYVGANGAEWIIMGYCLEVDYVGKTATTVPEGTHSAELDCDNGSTTAGNSSISTQVYLQVGSYELRWDYAGRIPNTYYQTSYICGTTAADTSWANDTSYIASGTTYGARTNQINVYLDQNTTGSPPVHTTLDGTQTLAGSNLIDECVYSYPPPTGTTAYPDGWIERSVPIAVSIAGYYWLSFAADGASDSFGGQIDDIRLCAGTCAGTLADNFPTSWLPANGSQKVLFEDTFESPDYTNMGAQNNQWYYNNGNVGLSYGSSAFWGESGKGWSAAPTNQIAYWEEGCPQGTQCIMLGWGTAANSNLNTLVSKPFLLVPGYYQIGYDYVSEVVFATDPVAAYCGTSPPAAGLPTSNSSSGTYRQIPGYGPSGNTVHDTNAVGVFMSHSQVASTPNYSSAFQNPTYYTNTTLAANGTVALNSDGTPQTTTSITPTVPPNTISLTNYTVSTTSPLLDICRYATSAQTRTRYVLILKAALYWLTFSALGTADGVGGEIDDVKITAIGSPTMSGSPASFVTIPVPNPQPGNTLSFTGFSITADLY